MKLKIIKNDTEYEEYLSWIDEQFDNKIKPDTSDGEKLKEALLLVKQYEDIYYSIPMKG